ncbi:MAG: zinc ribbon domain-containing protein [Thermofilum sp.]
MAGTPREKKKKAPGFEGYRVFRIEVSAALRQRLQALYIAIVRALQGAGSVPKGLLYYGKEFGNMVHAAVLNRFKAGKRTPPEKLPPIPLLVRFRWGGREYGSKNAVCVIDLDRCLLRIWNVVVPLDPKLCEALRGELELAPPPTFTLFLCQDGELRLVARRTPPRWWVAAREECSDYTDFYFPRPFVAVGVDVNSRNGVTIMAFEVSDEGVKRVLRRRIKFPKKEWRLVKVLQRFAALSSNVRKGRRSAQTYARLREAYEKLREGFPELPPTPSSAEEAVRVIHQAHAARVEARARRLSEIVRNLARAYGGRVAVFVDKPSPESLKGKPWQQSLLRVARRMRTTVRYEGGYYREVRVSGKRCPLCGERGVPYSPEGGSGKWKPRFFYCVHCGTSWNRDFNSSFTAIVAGLPWLAEELRGWLLNHPGDLLGSAPPKLP